MNKKLLLLVSNVEKEIATISSVLSQEENTKILTEKILLGKIQNPEENREVLNPESQKEFKSLSVELQQKVLKLFELVSEYNKILFNHYNLEKDYHYQVDKYKLAIKSLISEIKQKKKQMLVESTKETRKATRKKARTITNVIRELKYREMWSQGRIESLYCSWQAKFFTNYNRKIYDSLSEDIKKDLANLKVAITEYNSILRNHVKYDRDLRKKEVYFKGALEKSKDNKEILLSIKNLVVSFGYGNKKFDAVNDVSFDIYKGETFGLVGESGSGKTTIGRAIVKINPVSEGLITYRGVDIGKKLKPTALAEMRKKIQMIYQDPAASLNERATIDYIVSEGLRAFGLFENEVERKEKVEEAMKSVGLLPEHLRRYPHEFSGGQRQRIGIARSIVMRPEFIIADEPISALDVSIRAQVLNLLKSFQEEFDLTYLFIAHDLSVVRHIADRIAVISRGKIVELASAELLFDHPIHDYTISLLSAIPQPDPKLEKDKKLISYTPKFYADDEKVEFLEIEPGHFVLGNEEELNKYRLRLKGYKNNK